MKRTQGTAAYQEGDYFLVPLYKEVYVLGLVTRWDEGGYVIGFFFEPGTMEIPNSDIPKSFHYRPEDAIAILRFGDNFLLDGTWPIVGYVSSWNRNEWAVTKFALGESKINLFQIRHYDPDKPFYKPVKIENVTPDAIIGLPTDSSHGSKAAVYHLARLLQERHPVLNRKNVDAFYDELAKANQVVGMMPKTPTYKEGDYFLVPLQDELYALGLITRREQREFRGSAVLAFFFEPVSMEPLNPDIPQSFQHRPEDALDIMRFGNLFLLAGIWPIVGHAKPWNRDEWAVSRFAIGDNILKNYQIRYYDPDEPFDKPIRIDTVTPDAVIGLPTDSDIGVLNVPIYLSRLLQIKYPSLNETQIKLTYESLMANYKPDDEDTSDESGEHAVLVYWKLDNNQFGSPETYQTIQRLMDKLEASFAERDDIEFDGDEVGEGYATFFFYGSNADAMFSEITKVIKRFKPPEGSYAIKQYGTGGGKEIKVTI